MGYIKRVECFTKRVTGSSPTLLSYGLKRLTAYLTTPLRYDNLLKKALLDGLSVVVGHRKCTSSSRLPLVTNERLIRHFPKTYTQCHSHSIRKTNNVWFIRKYSKFASVKIDSPYIVKKLSKDTLAKKGAEQNAYCKNDEPHYRVFIFSCRFISVLNLSLFLLDCRRYKTRL